MANILHSLNPQQKQAAQTLDGPVLIIAGPGSGKTKTLTHRLAYLLQSQVPPASILGLTFTNKAGQEMLARVKKLLPNQTNLPFIGTFHGLGARFLRRHCRLAKLQSNFVIYDQEDSLRLIKNCLKELNLPKMQFTPAAVKQAISQAKNELLEPLAFQEQALDFWPEKVAQVYLLYQHQLEQNNALDFDDLLLLPVKIMRTNSKILQKYQEQYKYLLIDEYQDTNHAQYQLIKLLAGKWQNICAIGDPDQGIYQWRGADFKNILNFEKDWPQAKIIKLEQNYRSSRNILQAAQNIIVKNKLRKPKKLWTDNQAGALIKLRQLEDEKQEADFITQAIASLSAKHLGQIAVLYRTNAQSRALEEAFLLQDLPYKIIGSIRFYDRKEVKDVLAYLRLISNPSDQTSLERIINVPARGLGKAVSLAQIHNAKNTASPRQKNLLAFKNLLIKLSQQAVSQDLASLIKTTVKATGYQDFLLKDPAEGAKRLENVLELVSLANSFNQGKAIKTLPLFLEKAALLSSADEVREKQNAVNLMTLHCAKGLEFDTVFITGLEESILPHSRSLMNKQQMEEERRLCYVGITRAKQNLFLTFARQRQLFGATLANPPSRFLLDLPEEIVAYEN